MATFILLSAYTFSSHAGEPIRILALGDSLTAGYGLPAEDAFPRQLRNALVQSGLDADVLNAGVSGDTSAGGLSRLDWALATGGKGLPDMVIVELGANDGLRGLDPDQTFVNLDAILTRLKEQNLGVLLTGMRAPPNLGPEYGQEFAAVYTRLAEKHEILLYPFFLDGVAAIPALNQADAIHPNAEGVKVVVSRIQPYIIRVLNREP